MYNAYAPCGMQTHHKLNVVPNKKTLEKLNRIIIDSIIMKPPYDINSKILKLSSIISEKLEK